MSWNINILEFQRKNYWFRILPHVILGSIAESVDGFEYDWEFGIWQDMRADEPVCLI